MAIRYVIRNRKNYYLSDLYSRDFTKDINKAITFSKREAAIVCAPAMKERIVKVDASITELV